MRDSEKQKRRGNENSHYVGGHWRGPDALLYTRPHCQAVPFGSYADGRDATRLVARRLIIVCLQDVPRSTYQLSDLELTKVRLGMKIRHIRHKP